MGDAVLVCFQPITSDRRDSNETTTNNGDEAEASERQKNLLVRRGIECGLQLLARLSHYRVYLTAEERSKHRSPQSSLTETKKQQTIYDAMNPIHDDESVLENSTPVNTPLSEEKISSFEESHFLSLDDWMPPFLKKKNLSFHHRRHHSSRFIGKGKHRRTSETSDQSVNNADISNCVDLELHMALSCGDITNIILGDLDTDESETLHAPAASYSPSHSYHEASNGVFDSFFTQYHGRLEYAIGGHVVDALDEALSIAKAGELSITPSAFDIVQQQSMNLAFERRRRFFVIKNILDDHSIQKNNYLHPPPLKHTNTGVSRKGTPAIQNNGDYLKTLPGIHMQNNKIVIEPLIPRIRNTGYTNLPLDSNRYYSKYINRSALYRMQHSIDGNISAQFREVTIMFVSLGKTTVTTEDGLQKIQRAVLLVIEALVKYEGMLQQFAIDDKGKFQGPA